MLKEKLSRLQGKTLTQFMCSLENSGLVNAGIGSCLNLNGERELDSALLRVQSDGQQSLACVTGAKECCNPLIINEEMIREQLNPQTDKMSPPVFLAGESATRIGQRLPKSGKIDYGKSKDVKWYEKLKAFKDLEQVRDTIGSISIDFKLEAFQIEVCTSSGGPWLKIPGRVGSAAIRGAGFEFRERGNETCMVLCTGHGENLIKDQVANRVACQLIQTGILDAKEFLQEIRYDKPYDLGIVAVQCNTQTQKVTVHIFQTCELLTVGWALEQGDMIKKRQLKSFVKPMEKRYSSSSFTLQF
ncbi:hypothetical protein FGO68_gene8128 [Halteria grandinella]|uniref:Uncharacterized protein n=1 Tax=Halteria grandinella TaxID=5974 RepID=A0A8J8SW91_HALGN|nr:hypothetical protein FGO68_gene8128 [Halteria grandinella]